MGSQRHIRRRFSVVEGGRRRPVRAWARPVVRRRRRRRLLWRWRRLRRAVLPVVFLVLAGIGLFGWPQAGVPGQVSRPDSRAVFVSWVDGDSGSFGGRRFRLHGVDAPEGSPSRARCAQERRLAANARAAVRRLTGGKRVLVTRSYGHDRYGRELVDLSVDGRDVADTLVARGMLQRWHYEAGAPKPDWCGQGRRAVYTPS